MTKTIRIIDADLKYVRELKQPEERDQDTLHRLLLPSMLPTATGGNRPPTLEQIVEALKPVIGRETKNAVESALAR